MTGGQRAAGVGAVEGGDGAPENQGHEGRTDGGDGAAAAHVSPDQSCVCRAAGYVGRVPGELS